MKNLLLTLCILFGAFVFVNSNEPEINFKAEEFTQLSLEEITKIDCGDFAAGMVILFEENNPNLSSA